jgi:uncharacterized protein YgfB (UPF0149 family)
VPPEPDRFTYISQRFGKRLAKHFDTLEAACAAAVNDFHQNYATPMGILSGGREVMDQADILEAWEEKHLSGEKPTP